MNEFADLLARGGFSYEQIAEELGVDARTIRRYASGESEPKVSVILALRGLLAAGVKPALKKTPPAFRFIDLFAGIGGLRLGFESIGGQCVFTSEWDKYSQQTYRANFPNDEHHIAGDIRAVKATDIPEHQGGIINS